MGPYVGPLQIVEISFEVWGILFSLLALLCVEYDYKANHKEVVPFVYLLGTNCFVLIGDSMAIFFRGAEGTFGRVMVYASNYIAFAGSILLGYFGFIYLRELLKRCGAEISDVYLNIMRAVVLFQLILLTISQFTGWLYYVDEDNLYVRGKFAILNNTYLVFLIVIWCILLIKYGKLLPRKYLICILIYMIAPEVAGIVQTFFYGLSIIQIVTTMSIMVIFIVQAWNRTDFYMMEAKKAAEERESMHEWKMRTLRAQIQPHFIFNCLSTIHYLCEADPHMAAEATQRFSTFLRATVDGFDKEQCVSLTEEMYLVNNYLYLEKLRYGDRIHIEKRMEVNDMELPSFTIQTLVENAVKHGIAPKFGGGTIWINTYEEEDNYVIEIKDDGIGFDPTEIQNDGKNHVGLKNARERVEHLCGGKLEFVSTVGEGSTSKVFIPKR